MKVPKFLSDLPRELWGLVFQQLHNPLDQIQFGRVSTFMRSVAKENNPWRLSRALLMLPPNQDSEACRFFSLVDYNTFQIEIPELKNKWCCGSSFGWLFVVDFGTGKINLLNPFTRESISLPHISTFTNPPKTNFDQDRTEIWYIKKAILSAPPTRTNDFIVMAIFTNYWALAFWKPGDRKWTTLAKDRGPCEDMIYYREKLYAITNWGGLITWDLRDTNSPKLTVLIEATHELPYFRYLVELPNGSGILKISKLEDENGLTTGFRVYTLEDQGNKGWMEVGSLGDHAVFLGYNRAICLCIENNPECWGNSIYFTEDNVEKYYYQENGIDVGVCKLDDGSIRQFYKDQPSWKTHCLWLMPTFRASTMGIVDGVFMPTKIE